MKITDYNAMRSGEQKLFDVIIENLNWKAIREKIKGQFNIEVLTDFTVDGGDIVIRNNAIAYKIDLATPAGASVFVFVNRSGDLLEISASENIDNIRERLAKSEDEIVDGLSVIQELSALASELSDMILKINETGQGSSPKADS